MSQVHKGISLLFAVRAFPLKMSFVIVANTVGIANMIFVNTFYRGFYIFTTDCTVHRFDYTQEPGTSLYQVSIVTKDVLSTRPQLPQSLSCVDYHQDHSLVVLVGESSLPSNSNGCSGTPLWLSVLCCYIHH